MNIEALAAELSLLYEDLAQARKDHYTAEKLAAEAVASMFSTTQRVFELEKDVREVANDRAIIRVRMRELLQVHQGETDATREDEFNRRLDKMAEDMKEL